MAKGVLAISPADLSVSITGVAGPEPDEDGNPVGKVCIGVALCGGSDLAREYFIEAVGVDGVRQVAIAEALTLLLDTLRAANAGHRDSASARPGGAVAGGG
jgi:nicotinamide-nucleotide amidase